MKQFAIIGASTLGKLILEELIANNYEVILLDINPDVIFVDEIHYGFDGKMLQELIKDKSDTRIIGLSATPYDKTGNQLEGFGSIYVPD